MKDSNLMTVKRDLTPPPNFGSEIINYTNQNGTNSSIIHYSGVDISVDTGFNFHLTPPLITALQVPQNFCTIANLTSTTTNINRRLAPEFAPDGSIIIQPEDISDFEVDINECFRYLLPFIMYRPKHSAILLGLFYKMS